MVVPLADGGDPSPIIADAVEFAAASICVFVAASTNALIVSGSSPLRAARRAWVPLARAWVPLAGAAVPLFAAAAATGPARVDRRVAVVVVAALPSDELSLPDLFFLAPLALVGMFLFLFFSPRSF